MSALPGEVRALGVHDPTRLRASVEGGAVVRPRVGQRDRAVSLPRVPRGPKAWSSGWNARLGVSALTQSLSAPETGPPRGSQSPESPGVAGDANQGLMVSTPRAG